MRGLIVRQRVKPKLINLTVERGSKEKMSSRKQGLWDSNSCRKVSSGRKRI